MSRSIELKPLGPDSQPTLVEWRELLQLARKHRGTLGFLPDSAFADRVRRGTLIIALLDGRVAGYCLYDVQRRGVIKLIHVCADTDARRVGTGRSLVNAVIAQHPSALGLVAFCRRDYDLDRFWISVGLSPRGERPGRAQGGGSILVRWWRPLGALDLLESAALDGGRLLVAYDTNVVSDLCASPSVDRPDRLQTQGLMAGWLQAEITPVISPRVDVELNRIADRAERDLQRGRSEQFVRLRSGLAEDGSLLERLLQQIPDDLLAADGSLVEDFAHVADALAAGARYFVTNDAALIAAARIALPTDAILRVLRPHELVAAVLKSIDRPTFESRLIQSLDLTWVPASDHQVRDLAERFLSHERGERPVQLERSIREAIAHEPASTRVLVDADGRLWALLADHQDGELLSVDLLRVERSDMTSTIAMQLARHLRAEARELRLSTVEVRDANVATAVIDALRRDGYLTHDTPRARLIDDAWDCESFAQHEGVPAPTLLPEVREVERAYWPLTLLSTAVPTFLAPIKPRFAEALFGLDRGPTLWDSRKRALGLSREHVYYSGSPHGLPQTGARILWYASSDRSGRMSRLVAYSRSLGWEVMQPDQAHAANSPIGVYTLRDVKTAANSRTGLVSVIRFEDTEVLRSHFGGLELAELLQRHGVRTPLMTFRRVDAALFDDVVRVERKFST